MNSDFLRFIPKIGIYPYFSDINTQIKIILLQRLNPGPQALKRLKLEVNL